MTGNTIRAAVVDRAGDPFVIRDLTLDNPRDDEIVVRIVGVGLCHTDIVAQSGGFGYTGAGVFGHEGSGIVEKTGSAVTKFRPGDRVAISFRSCGECVQCKDGYPSYCHTMPQLNYAGTRIDGSTSIFNGDEPVTSNFFGQSSFANFAITYERNLVLVPENFPLEMAGPLGCGIQTGAGAIMRSMACEEDSILLITGGGSVGLSAVMGAAIQHCATIIVVEPLSSRRELAHNFGATHSIDPTAEEDLAAAIRKIAPSGVNYALDTTGRPETIEAIFGALAPRGLVGLVGIAAPGTLIPIDINTIMTPGSRIMGIIEGDSDPETFIPELIAHYQAGRLPFDRMIKTYPLSQINEAVSDQHQGICVKAVLLP
ncbi:NAD(P)-dependent alcohol dehydrogenase [Parasphingorhabdus sp. JC815]|uniref:NAD(P)-dependent alcohol dehydrogenase n=1 Tax=Parasphingorhabdus sp. JC815 TaxID=3232140 RepID=UPI00345A7135